MSTPECDSIMGKKYEDLEADAEKVKELKAAIDKKFDLASRDPPTVDGELLICQVMVTKDMKKSRAFYVDILGGKPILDFPTFMKVTVGNLSLAIDQPDNYAQESPDKPGIRRKDADDADEVTVSSFLNLRVPDIEVSVKEWKEKGVTVVMPPSDRGSEVRCYLRDPDGHVIEAGQTKDFPSCFAFPFLKSISSNLLVSRFTVVNDYKKSRDFYIKLGGEAVVDAEEYSFGFISLANTWIGLCGAGGPTDDKPGISLAPCKADETQFASWLAVRTPDVQKTHAALVAKGIDTFITAPIVLPNGVEERCYMKDPDGNIVELGQIVAK